jgi:hypothetical protein
MSLTSEAKLVHSSHTGIWLNCAEKEEPNDKGAEVLRFQVLELWL